MQEHLSAPTSVRIQLSKVPGYVGNTYLCANGFVIGNGDQPGPKFMPNVDIQLPTENQRGTLEDWQSLVAPYALNSNRLMLSLCTAFAGLILRFSDVESGGFHIFGKSSIGKSTCLLFAASVYGDNEFVRSWAITPKAFEEISSAHNDSLLVLDELMLAGSDEKQAAKHVRECTYTISEGKGKSRSTSYQQVGSEWYLLALSAGELSLEQHARKGGAERIHGETVRLIDIPADAGMNLGIYESLPEGCKSSSELAAQIHNALQVGYGTPKNAFIEKLFEYEKLKEGQLKEFIEKRISYFIEKNRVDISNGTTVRIAKKFALAYAAGYLAERLGILPLDRRSILHAISACYKAAMNSRPIPIHEQVEAAQSKIRTCLNDDKTIDLRNKENLPTRKQTKRAASFITRIKGQDVLAIATKHFEKLNPDEHLRKALIAELRRQNSLVRSNDNRNTRQLSIPKLELKPRCYCILLSSLVN